MLPGHRARAECRNAPGPPTVRRWSRCGGTEANARPREQPSHVWYLWQNWNRQVSIAALATSLRFAVIGAGRLGASLALALSDRGQTLVGFTAGSAAGQARAEEWLGLRASPTLAELVRLDPDAFFVCVPDGAILAIGSELGATIRAASKHADARPDGRRRLVAHTSGATSVEALRPCEEAGAAALVFHPLQTFPEPLTGFGRFAGAGVAITPGSGDPDTAGTFGMRLADILGMRPFFLADDKRSLYHAAATVACNYLVTLEYLADDLFIKAGVPERVAMSLFMPLVTATLDNLAAHGPVAALTGPLSRGDTATVEGHLQALASEAPEVVSVYRAMGLATLDLVKLRGEVGPEVITGLRRLLGEAGPGWGGQQ
jgi:predicted short-subunit dehydrogenase-like oxidoreductase (DUF2520 family)